jgi:hypothetical protein
MKMANMNNDYARIKVPHSFSRSIRNFKAFIHWKANEIKVFLLYTGLPILFKYLQTKYFEHFCLYVLIIRRLCDTNIPDKEHDNTKRLLNIWQKDVEGLYGLKDMTYTAHVHLHLVDQVRRLGPLHRIAAFSFEGMLKHIKAKITGTRFIGNQIVKRILIEKYSIKKTLEIEEIHTLDFATHHLLPKVFKKDILYDSKIDNSIKFSSSEINALKSFDGTLQDLIGIDCFSRLKQGNYSYNSHIYNSGQKRCSSYAKWQNKSSIEYGLIVKFLNLKSKHLFIAMKFKVLDLQKCLNSSSKYKQAFDICRLEDYFTIVSNNDFAYVCLPVTCLKANCLYVKISEESFGIITEVFDFEHD